MIIKNKFLKASKVCLFALVAALCINLPTAAAVYTNKSDSGLSDTVYVAGNPDCFPIEYYDSEKGSFCGVIPDMLNEVSKKTGISFTYVSASSKNRQRELARNNQVEIITAITLDQKECEVSSIIPILKADNTNNNETYCIGFTEIASPELVKTLKSAFSEISDQEKMGLMLENARNNPKIESRDKLIKIIITLIACLFAATGIFVAVIAYKKKRHRFETLIDELTGVGNADYYTHAFNNLLSYQSRNLYSLNYLAFDFKTICEKYGENDCSEIEKYAAAHLNAAITSSDYLARIKTGVFVLLLQAPTEQECDNSAQNIVSSLNRYIEEFYPEEKNLFSAGVCRLCEHLDCNAETALYNAKQGYLTALRNQTAVEITCKTQLTKNRKQENLRKSLASAVKNGEFRVYMQLIIESQKEKVCGMEILSRWQNSEYGMLRPLEYIDLLKETGQIVPHDYKMFSEVCKQLEAWESTPYNSLFLACNFTRISLCQKDFADRIEEISSKFKFNHNRLVIEITEDSISTDVEVISENIRRCREMGFKIAIDDMGAGFSSFADLYDNEIDMVKINSEFIASCISNRQQTMLSDIISLVHNSGAGIVCEGVENADQIKLLNTIGCDMLQGFYYSGILPQVECLKLLKTKNICDKPFFENQL